jgi:hypothetical protein
MPACSGVGEVDRDLRVLDPPGGAGVLPLHPDRAAALLHVPGLVDDQHRAGLAEVGDDVVAQGRSDAVGVPDRPGQQVLHAVGRGIAGVLGKRPTVLARQIGQQPQHEGADPAPALDPAEPAGYPIQQLIDARAPAGRPYLTPATTAGPSDVHTPDDGHAVAALLSQSRSSDLRLEY